jgi:uncharacterized protein (DUF305 family)
MRRGALGSFVTVLALFASGCGLASKPPAVTAPVAPATAGANDQTRNATDVMFLQMLIPHHGQGLEIVRHAKTRATRDEVRILAAAIDVTQSDEVKTMAGWLTAWGEPLQADEAAHAAHGGMPGTSAQEIATLAQSTGATFERAFLNMLIAHQDDAVQLARMEASGGTNPQAVALARRVDASRTEQIKQMLELLRTL